MNARPQVFSRRLADTAPASANPRLRIDNFDRVGRYYFARVTVKF